MNKIALAQQIGPVSAIMAIVAMTTYLLHYFVVLVVNPLAPTRGLSAQLAFAGMPAAISPDVGSPPDDSDSA